MMKWFGYIWYPLKTINFLLNYIFFFNVNWLQWSPTIRFLSRNHVISGIIIWDRFQQNRICVGYFDYYYSMNNVNLICLITANLFINQSCLFCQRLYPELRLSSISVVVFYLFCLLWVDRRSFSSTCWWYHCISQ